MGSYARLDCNGAYKEEHLTSVATSCDIHFSSIRQYAPRDTNVIAASIARREDVRMARYLDLSNLC